MSELSDAHTQWHQMYGKYTTCNLDCGAGEIVGDIFEADEEALKEPGAHRVKCGSCGNRHASVSTVKFCYEVKREDQKLQLADAA